MEDSIDAFAEVVNSYSAIERVRDLYDQLQVNVAELDMVIENIEKTKESNEHPNVLEHLYGNEFRLLMDNFGIYEDLKTYLDKVEKTPENEFELARIRRDLSKLVTVEVIE